MSDDSDTPNGSDGPPKAARPPRHLTLAGEVQRRSRKITVGEHEDSMRCATSCGWSSTSSPRATR